MKLELFGSPLTGSVQSSIALFMYLRLPFQYIPLQENPVPDWYLKIVPTGTTPALRIDSEFTISSNSIISEYISELSPHHLLPQAPLQRAQVRMQLEMAKTLLAKQEQWLHAGSERQFQQNEESFFQLTLPVEKHFRGPFARGKNPSLVDMAWVPIFSRILYIENRCILDSFWQRRPTLYRWYMHMLQQDWMIRSVPHNFDELLTANLASGEAWIGRQEKEIVLL